MNLKLAVVPNCLRIAVLGRPPFLEEAPGIVTVIRVGRIRRRSQRGRCSVRGLVGPGKRTKIVIYNKPIGELEQIIIMNRGYQSHLMRRRHWFIGMFSSGISSAACLPRLSSPAMKDDWVYGRKEENRYRVLAGRGEQRDSYDGDVYEAEALGWYLKT